MLLETLAKQDEPGAANPLARASLFLAAASC